MRHPLKFVAISAVTISSIGFAVGAPTETCRRSPASGVVVPLERPSRCGRSTPPSATPPRVPGGA